ncbi:MAG: glycosyltransferase family 4 protein, partial [bacterium]|nr:glycosyltransferase family 4 protein [bacterium]
YFIQGYETWQGQIEKVDNSYRLPLKKIVIASWLKKLMEEKFGDADVPLITNAVNLAHFFNEDKRFNSPARILLMHHEAEYKGMNDALKALEIVKSNKPDVEIIMFGTKKPADIPNGIEFHLKPYGEKLRQLYCSSDIFVSPSWSEGCQLPPMEAMACQCAVVASNVGGIPDYSIPGKTALVFEPRDIQTMANHIIYLLENPDELKRISFAGYQHIKHFTWDHTAQKMEQIFLNALAEQA